MELPDPQAPFDRLCTPEILAPGRMRVVIPETWNQGRGLFGGFVTALLTRALEAFAGADRPLRSLTSEICGPAQPGEAILELDAIRVGNAVSTVAVRLVQGPEVQAHGVGVLGRARGHDTDRVDLVAPPRTPWRDVPELGMVDAFSPAFGQHVEFRSTGPRPFGGSADPVITGWVRLRRPGERRDAAYLAACIDTFWPALCSVIAAPRPMATIAFTFQPFLREGAPLGDDPLYFRSRLAAAHAGYCVELRELWHGDGTLVALNQQTMVVIK